MGIVIIPIIFYLGEEMKKFMLHGFLAMLTASMIVGCGGSSGGGDTDTTEPVITILGDNPVEVIQNTTYTDAGATARDNVDGTVAVTVSGTVDTSAVDTYIITYTARDAAGNRARADRTVNVTAAPLRAIDGVIRSFRTGLGLPNIRVSAGSQIATTNASGEYTLRVSTGLGERVVITVSGDGFATTSAISGVGQELEIDMLDVGSSATFDGSNDFVAVVPGTVASVAISAGTLVRNNGAAPTGDITAELTPINPAVDINLMPGDMTVANGDPIASYGAMTVDFVDAAGNELNLAPGETATIRIPTSYRGGDPLPATIPFFYYDGTQGFWVQEGTGTLSSDRSYYEGTVTHFTTWNSDYLYEYVTIKGCVQELNASIRVANATVNLIGSNYNGSANTRTDSAGNFEIRAMKSAISLINAQKDNEASNTVSVRTANIDVEMTDCLVIATAPLTATLTWGENPRDLDTHLIGPNNLHIYYVNKGSLSSAPFINLDVDDVSSYGPEVLTALSFPVPGTYHYAVYRFSGSSTISASPARVEVVVNGQRHVFVPAAGQTDERWWNVFDITVADNGAISITTINTWSDTAPGASSRLGKMVMPAKN